ncbi:MAG: hypothetical protein JO112_10715, partial [Planctomycetes bacterium]|nr:hypothetical protein [Planctomycetota bacterium]
MTQENRFRLADGLWFLVILILAFGARAWYLHACAKDGQGEGPLQVQETSLGGLVLLPGRTTESLESLPSRSLYPWLLDRLEAKTQDPESAGRWTRWIQAGLGALTAALYCLLAGRVLGSRWVGLVAGLLAAVYPFWIINTAELHDGVLATFLLAAALFLGGVGNQAG